MIIIIILKRNSRVDPRPGLSYMSGWPLTCINIRIKLIIIIVLKPNLVVDSRLSPCQGLGWPLTLVNIRIQMIINIILKPNWGVDPEQCLGYEYGRSTRVNLKKYKNKNDCYYSFKNLILELTRGKSWLRVKGVNSSLSWLM
jgi:hypothetical protein